MNVGCGRFCKELLGMHGIFPLNSWAKEPLSSYEEFSSEDEDEDTHDAQSELPVKLTPIPHFLQIGIKTNENPQKNAPAHKLQALKRLLPRSQASVPGRLPKQERRGDCPRKCHRDTKNHWL